MTKIKNGDTVRIHYTGTLDDGAVFDTSAGRDPLEFVMGAGYIINGLEAAVMGMSVGEKKTAKIGAMDAYGPIYPEARQAVPRADIPDDIPLELGLQLEIGTAEGHTMPVTVVEITDEEVMLDANHPLAGQDLTFEFEIISVAGAVE